MNITFSKLYGNFDEDYGTGLFNTSSFLEDEPGWNSADPNRYGHLGQDRPIIFKLMGTYDLPFGFIVGGFLRVQSGTPWEARGGTPSTSSGRYLEPAGTNRLPTWTTFDLLLAYTFKSAATWPPASRRASRTSSTRRRFSPSTRSSTSTGTWTAPRPGTSAGRRDHPAERELRHPDELGGAPAVRSTARLDF